MQISQINQSMTSPNINIQASMNKQNNAFESMNDTVSFQSRTQALGKAENFIETKLQRLIAKVRQRHKAGCVD